VEPLSEALARRTAEREVASRQSAHAREVQRILDATYRVIERTGDVDPSMRTILREAELSTQTFYRHFRSKDELLLVLLDDGRRRLLTYLEHRMARVDTRDEKLREWIAGVLAQASSAAAAERTRPFVADQDRIAERFPAEQQASADALTDLLAGALAAGRGAAARRQAQLDAQAVYHLAFGTLHRHLTYRTRPTRAEVEHLVRFARKGAA
jgi:AcrR family transcriptional regulator